MVFISSGYGFTRRFNRPLRPGRWAGGRYWFRITDPYQWWVKREAERIRDSIDGEILKEVIITRGRRYGMAIGGMAKLMIARELDWRDEMIDRGLAGGITLIMPSAMFNPITTLEQMRYPAPFEDMKECGDVLDAQPVPGMNRLCYDTITDSIKRILNRKPRSDPVGGTANMTPKILWNRPNR